MMCESGDGRQRSKDKPNMEISKNVVTFGLDPQIESQLDKLSIKPEENDIEESVFVEGTSSVSRRRQTPPVDIPVSRRSSESSSHSDGLSFSAPNYSPSPRTPGSYSHFFEKSSNENEVVGARPSAEPLMQRQLSRRRRVQSECIQFTDNAEFEEENMPMRNRSHSLPGFILERQRELGRELRRIGDDFQLEITRSKSLGDSPFRSKARRQTPLTHSHSYPDSTTSSGVWHWLHSTMHWMRSPRTSKISSHSHSCVDTVIEDNEEDDVGDMELDL